MADADAGSLSRSGLNAHLALEWDEMAASVVSANPCVVLRPKDVDFPKFDQGTNRTGIIRVHDFQIRTLIAGADYSPPSP